MKAPLAWLLAATLLSACGGGGGNPGTCSGSPQYCAEFAPDSTTATPSATTGVVGLFTKSGSGAAVFNLPADVTRLRVQATHAGAGQNFVVAVADQVLVNEVIGTAQIPPAFDGTYLVTGGAKVEVRNATGIAWTFTQVQQDPIVDTGGVFARTGSGDTVFELPPRVRRVRIQGTYAGASQNFVVTIADRLVVNAIVGTAQNPPSVDGTFAIEAGGTVQIRGSSGVAWSLQEVP